LILNSIQFEIVKTFPVEEIVNLYKAAEWWEENAHSREIIPPMIQGSFCFMIATCEGNTLGMGRVISDGFSDGYILDIVVHAKYRSCGIGKELVHRLTHFCIEKKLETIYLIAKPGTSYFYEKLGFKVLKDFQPMIFDKES
jgi:N-acetylglutamate synthase-like GNAT family acetyltransferase